ncbi:ribosome maturation factor RimP [Actinokineospora sp. PR83]|uniref:ribosome maturation factor RimP n=1 Tax=Actinokineospora sp. PR83 TaxID=2884908 RepID=UPI0027E120AE|nr:ribosome maturation factor RimP [Actinokineospora sp. PR83]MCG8920627.1 ribosome maturation factor RimP [Actinokineospora sp. PR83]
MDTALHPVVADAVGAAGFELEELDVSTAGRRRLVRVVIDSADSVENGTSANSANAVGLDEVARVSRELAAVLDEHDAVLGGPYTLEVTSPGTDRPLTRPRHWKRNRLRLVKVRPVEGAEYLGRVGDADAEETGGVTLLVDGAPRRVGYAEVAHAVVEVEFKQPPAAELAMLEGRASEDEEDAR